MPGPEGYLAFDVGKTNKKLLVYDRDLNLIDGVDAVFATQLEDDVEVEPVGAIAE